MSATSFDKPDTAAHIEGMETSEQTRARITAVLDQLGPGAWLHLDERWLTAAFGDDDTEAKAKAFAEANHCAFRYDPGPHRGDGKGIFGRAYPKRLTDV